MCFEKGGEIGVRIGVAMAAKLTGDDLGQGVWTGDSAGSWVSANGGWYRGTDRP